GQSSAAAAGAEPVRVEPGEAGSKLPELGVVIYPEDVEAALGKLPLLSQLGPQQLLLHYDPTRGHGLDALRAHAALASAFSAATTLECVVACDGDLDAELSAVAAMVRQAG
ncbi:hypothetical protein EN803_38265, partial [Mesorhizobium sp. M2D.F.Ca.ET.160.01.1.1]